MSWRLTGSESAMAITGKHYEKILMPAVLSLIALFRSLGSLEPSVTWVSQNKMTNRGMLNHSGTLLLGTLHKAPVKRRMVPRNLRHKDRFHWKTILAEMPPGTNKKPTICRKNPVVPLMPIKTNQSINDDNNSVLPAAVLKLEEKLGCPTLRPQFFAYSYLIPGASCYATTTRRSHKLGTQDW